MYFAKKFNRKHVEIWGTGKPKREIIFVEDIADACIYFMNKKTKHKLINFHINSLLSFLFALWSSLILSICLGSNIPFISEEKIKFLPEKK